MVDGLGDRWKTILEVKRNMTREEENKQDRYQLGPCGCRQQKLTDNLSGINDLLESR